MKNFLSVSLVLLLTPFALFSQDIVINEVQAKNIKTYKGPFALESYLDWIELKNTTATSIDISGYYLSDDESNVIKYQFPSGTTIAANDFLIVHAVGENFNDAINGTVAPSPLYTAFKLSSNGETVTLSAADETLIDQVTYPAIQNDITYGRLADGTYSFLSNPTVGAVNDTASQFTVLESNLSANIPSGLYSAAQTITLTKTGVGSIYYTTDGTIPKATSTLYTAPITINTTSVLKAIVINSPSKYSLVENNSYVIGATHSLPVILLTSDNSSYNFRDKEVIDGRVNFQFIETDGTVSLNQYANFNASGKTSSFTPQINGKIKADKLYGDNDFDYKMYPNKKIDKFTSFLFRNSSQDWGEAHLRDAFIARVLGQDNLTNIPFEGYRPAVIYVNGLYQGIINVREDDDNDYVKHNYGLNDEDFCIEYSFCTDAVSPPSFSTDRAELDSIRSFNDIINLNFMIEYTALNEYGFKVWQNFSPDHPYYYNYFMHDFDATFGLSGDTFVASAAPDMNISQLIPNNYRNYTPYKNEAAQYIAALLNHIYNKERTSVILNEMEAELEYEISAHAVINTQLGIDQGWDKAPFANLAEWQDNVQDLRTTIDNRYNEATILSEISTEYGLSTTVKVTYNSSNSAMGFVRVHDIKSKDESFTGTYFSGLPIKFSAQALPGYRFVKWQGDVTDTTNNITPSFTTNANITAVFEAIPIPSTKLVINEVQSKNDSTVADENGEYDDWIENYNPESTTINLAGYYISDNLSLPLKWQIPSTDASKTTVPANGFLLLWADGEISQGENHVNFKLKGTDELILTAPDAVTTIQSISFTDLTTDTSYGSETDADPNYILFTTPTPNATNDDSLSVGDVKMVSRINIYPNPVKDLLYIRNTTTNLTWEIYDLAGRLISKGKSKKINVSSFKQGIYLIKLNNLKTVNFIKK